MPRRNFPKQRTAAGRTPENPDLAIEAENIEAASRAMPGKREALPPGSLVEQSPDSQATRTWTRWCSRAGAARAEPDGR